MRMRLLMLLVAVGLSIGLVHVNLSGQADDPQKHIATAKAAAGPEWAEMFDRLCVDSIKRIGVPPAAPAATAPAPAGPPARSTWEAEPVKVFDNLYFVGTKEHSAWAITTSDGIILMDAIFDYNIQAQVVEGLKKVGLNPASLKYAILGHWHGDHAGGAKALQDQFGTKIIMGAGDWDNMDKLNPAYKPKKDIVATDGMKVTVGDTTVTTYVTPGHTQGTLSSIFTVKDNGTPHVVAYWGGTLYNWIGATTRSNSEYFGKPESFWFAQYADSAARFKEVAARAGADVYMSNHTAFDGSKPALAKLATRKPGDPNPYVIGRNSVQGYLTMAGECARAAELVAKK